MSEPSIEVAARWVIENHDPLKPDHACGQCCPGDELEAPGFACNYHRAMEALAPSPITVSHLRMAWEQGFACARGYGDNHQHWEGLQKERAFMRMLAIIKDAPVPF